MTKTPPRRSILANEFVEHTVGWPPRERNFILLVFFKQRISNMAEHTVLRVNLSTVHHDGFNLAVHALALGLEMMTHIVQTAVLPAPVTP